jgi:hypothetical protein
VTLSLEQPPRTPVTERWSAEQWSAEQFALVAAGRRLYAEESFLVQQTSTSSWIVRDRRVRDGGRSLLGCIEMRGEVYEVMRVGDGFQWHTLSTLQEAVQNLTELAIDSGSTAVDDDFSWLR